MAKMTCPICKGSGKIHEDATEYEFITREAITKRCLYCDGSGKIEPRVKMPDGRWAHELAPGRDKKANPKRLNVSKKAINPETVDTGIGYQKKEKYETPRFYEMAVNERLNKVLAGGKEFLIVTETEPYYLDVYQIIRSQERKQNTWTADDESRYVECLEKELARYKEAING